jgi:hypothetical protein
MKNKMKNIENNIKIIPIKSYKNLKESKRLIYEDNINKSGIYRWTNLITNKSYVGSAINLTKRFRNYLSVKHLKLVLLKAKSIIHSSMLKNNYENFELDILEYCEKDSLIEREQFYIDLLKPEYNILETAGSRLGSKHTLDSKKKMSIKSRGRKILYDNKVSRVYLPKLVNSDTRLKLALRNRGVNVKIFDSSNILVNEFTTIKSAANYMGINYNTISKIYETGISYDGFIYKFEPKDLRVWVYDSENKFIEVLENAKKVSENYNLPKSTLSNYIKSGKLYKNSFYFYNSKNKPIN